ncbi:MAG: hypothetical protein QOF74_2086 [Caballeronia mineralivorans]|jgi:hypothetical protein|nr:hypothetical protein [Caballeronia mineralivorans]
MTALRPSTGYGVSYDGVGNTLRTLTETPNLDILKISNSAHGECHADFETQ